MIAGAVRLSIRQVLHHPGKSVLAVLGIAFPVAMIFLQLGFLGSVIESAESVLRQLRADIILTSPSYRTVGDPDTIPRERIAQAMAVDGVEGAIPLAIGKAVWRSQMAGTDSLSGLAVHPTGLRPLMVFGIRGGTQPFLLDEVVRQSSKLAQPGSVLIDTRSHPQFGTQTSGTLAEASGRAVRIAGRFTLGTGFSSDGAVIASEADFPMLTGLMTADGHAPVSLGLVTLTPEADAEAVAAQLRALLPVDTIVRTRVQVLADDRAHWVWREAIGVIFVFGVGVAMLVGVAIIVQILSSDIADNRKEYATIKAMGYRPSFLSRVVETQALLYALAAFAISWAASVAVLDPWTRAKVNLPVEMWWQRIAASLAMTVLMCWASARWSIRSAQRADPASLF